MDYVVILKYGGNQYRSPQACVSIVKDSSDKSAAIRDAMSASDSIGLLSGIEIYDMPRMNVDGVSKVYTHTVEGET